MASLADLERDLRRLQRSARAELDAATMRAARQGMTHAKKLSSGPFGARSLAEIDAPYAVRHGAPKLPPEVINARSGVFREHWTATRAPSADGTVLIKNTDPKAKFLERGTPTMFARPIDVPVELFVTRTALPLQIQVAILRIQRTPHA